MLVHSLYFVELQGKCRRVGPYTFCSAECRDAYPDYTLGPALRSLDVVERDEPETCDNCQCDFWADGRREWWVPKPREDVARHRELFSAVLAARDIEYAAGRYGPFDVAVGAGWSGMLNEVYQLRTDGELLRVRDRLLALDGLASVVADETLEPNAVRLTQRAG